MQAASTVRAAVVVQALYVLHHGNGTCQELVTVMGYTVHLRRAPGRGWRAGRRVGGSLDTQRVTAGQARSVGGWRDAAGEGVVRIAGQRSLAGC